ncbi:hypothetical protein MN116_007111 [Schistosoma mekongi]|uniref:Uncharacterized protein n=1 Tax=Schistosoma mekongi TaxID=38744 RepID=A0AAE2D396_SCHME|nr:hypothetical protein MN116_007111 [Schistosoma mekongi]
MTSSGCRSWSSCNTGGGSPITLANNNNKELTMGRPLSSISLITDQLKLSSLNERDSCMTMRMIKTIVGLPITTTTSMTSDHQDVSYEHYGLETINETRNAYSMPTHPTIGIQSKRNITGINNDNSNSNIADWKSGPKDYHHSRTVHFHDVFTPSSSICSSLQSEFEDGNEVINPEHHSSSLHVLSASAPATNYVLNSMPNVLRSNEIPFCNQHPHRHLHFPHQHICINNNKKNDSNGFTTMPSVCLSDFSSSFPCSINDKPDHYMDTIMTQSNMESKAACSSSSLLSPSSTSAALSCYCCCPTYCPCCLCRQYNPSFSEVHHLLHDRLPPAKRVCRSTSSSSDVPPHQLSPLYGGFFSHRQIPFTVVSSCCSSSYMQPLPPSISSFSLPSHSYCHQCCKSSVGNNSNTQHSSVMMMKTLQAYMKNLPRPIAVRLESKAIYNEKSKSCTNMDNVKLLNSHECSTNSNTLRNNNNNNANSSGVILRPKPSDFISLSNKMINNGSRISWHHPLFNFGSSNTSQVKHNSCNNSNGNTLSSQTEVNRNAMQHDISPMDISQTYPDNAPVIPKSVHLRNIQTSSSNNSSNQADSVTTTVYHPSHIEVRDSHDSSLLSIHALPSPSSAFTPTRASLGSFPIDVSSPGFSFSPTTGSMSSSVQIITQTPSSGFHEASFYGLSEASSLPDCSKINVCPESASSSYHCQCHCHQHHHEHHSRHRDHHHRRNQTNISSIDTRRTTSTRLTDLEPCFKLEDSEPNTINDHHNYIDINANKMCQSRNDSSGSSSCSSSSGNSCSNNNNNCFHCCSCSLSLIKCAPRCCSRQNDNTIYDINCKHLPNCSRTLKHTRQSPCSMTIATTNTTTCTPFISVNTMPKTTTITSSHITITNTAAGLKRRRGLSGECSHYYRDNDSHIQSNNYHYLIHEQGRKQLAYNDDDTVDLSPCNFLSKQTPADHLINKYDNKVLTKIDHLHLVVSSNSRLEDNLDCHYPHQQQHHNHRQSYNINTNDICSYHDAQHSLFPFITDQHSLCSSSSASIYSSVFDSCKCRDNTTLIESAITNVPSTVLSSSSSSTKQHSTHSYLNNINSSNNQNNKITECVTDNNLCSFINSVHSCHISFDDRNKYNICNMNCGQEYEHCSSVFSEDNFLHRHTCNELGKLYEMTEDEKEHETPETMIDESSNNNSIRLSDIKYHYSFVSLSSPSIHDITFTPIHPSTIQWDDNLEDKHIGNNCKITPVQHNSYPDVMLSESIDDSNTQIGNNREQVLLFTPSSMSSNSDRESNDMETMLSPQMPNRQRISTDVLLNESNSNKHIMSFIDLDLELIEND